MSKKTPEYAEQEARENELDRDIRKVYQWANRNRDFVRSSYKGLSVFGMRKEVVKGDEEIAKRMASIFNNIDWLIQEIPHIRWQIKANQERRRGREPKEVY